MKSKPCFWLVLSSCLLLLAACTQPAAPPTSTRLPPTQTPSDTPIPQATASFTPSPVPTIAPTPTIDPVYSCEKLDAPPNGPFLVGEDLLIETSAPGEWAFQDLPFSGYTRDGQAENKTRLVIHITQETHDDGVIHFSTEKHHFSFWLDGEQYGGMRTDLVQTEDNGDGSGTKIGEKQATPPFEFDTIRIGFGTKNGYTSTHVQVSKVEILNLCWPIPPPGFP